MKKRRLSSILLIATIIALSFIMLLAACNRNLSKLDTPSLVYRPYEVVWDKCDGAEMYSVYVSDLSGELQQFSGYAYSPRIDLEYYKGKRVRVRVIAIAGGKKSIDSDAAEAEYNVNDVSDSVKEEEDKAYAAYYSALEIEDRYYYSLTRDDGSINTDNLTIYSGSSAITASGIYSVGFNCVYDSGSGVSVISADYLRGFSAGAVIPLIMSDGAVVEVEIVDNPVARVINGDDYGIVVYYNSLNSHMYLQFDSKTYVRRIYADAKTRLDFTHSADSRGVSIARSSMAQLSQGEHTLSLYTDRGDIRARILVIPDYTFRLDNLHVDIDGYPDIVLSWEEGLAPDYYVVSIGGVQYRSDSSVYSDRFYSGGMDITSLAQEGDRITVTAYSGNRAISADSVVPLYSSYLEYLTSTFEYIGERYNMYIDSEDEWTAAIGHIILHYDDLQSGTVYDKSITLALAVSGYSYVNLNDKFAAAVKAFRELVSYRCEIRQYVDSSDTKYNDIFKIDITIDTVVTPDRNYTELDAKYTDLIVPVFDSPSSAYLHYGDGSRGEEYNDFAIESLPRAATAQGSDELYLVIEAGYRPVIADASSPAGRMYAKAKSVLRRIIDDGMTDYDKVHAIADYLNGEITYDSAVAKYESELFGGAGYSAIYPYNCFFLEGVFDDGVAVCNGLAKAFVVLCGIEGIRSVKIQGYTSPISRTGRHAWNKVNIGGEWYGIDTTWDNLQTEIDGDSVRIATHNYAFLTSERLERSGHYQDSGVLGSEYYCGDSAYNLYANMLFNYGGKIYDHIVGGKAELETLFSYYTSTYGGDRIVVYAYCGSRLIAGSISVTSDGYRVKMNSIGGEYIYILEK